MGSKLAVVAIGGNALCPDQQHLGIEKQYSRALETAEHIADIMLEGWNVVVVHGNGPQVGMVLRRAELSREELPPISMDYAGADVQGTMGYMLVKALWNAFIARGIQKRPVAIITQTLVSADDPAFLQPTKPIGSWFSEEQAAALAVEHGWRVMEDSGRGWRRVVASPIPIKIIEEEAIAHMVDLGIPVIALGGGGIPVIETSGGALEGVDAVIDKDMSSALLAQHLGAEMFILPTAVEKVAVQFGRPGQRWLDTVSIEEAEGYFAAGEFPPGSMGPKMQALIQYVRATGGTGLITTPECLKEAVQGKTGTHIIP